ncbi:MAG: DUF4271 domain-containing protein [Paludibacter sp.]|nr:DUF4271 domain-containing protein [Paludibacter sp.]
MIQPDSISTLQDSILTLPADSLARIDSLAHVDSLALADSIRITDSIKALINIPTGYIGIPHPSLPHTENWVFGVLFCLFLIMTFSISFSSGLLSDAVKSFFQVKERSSIFSKSTINTVRFKFFIIAFSIGVLSFYSYLLTNTSNEFSLSNFLVIFLITGIFFLLKSFLFELIGYVFFDSSSLKLATESYFNVLSFLGILLFPVLVMRIYVSIQFIHIIDTIALILSVFAVILVIIKLIQIFLHKIVASFYIMLYLCTLEFLPLFILFRVYQLIV